MSASTRLVINPVDELYVNHVLVVASVEAPKAEPQFVDANCQPRVLLAFALHGFALDAVLVNENADRPFQLLSALTKALLNVELDPEKPWELKLAVALGQPLPDWAHPPVFEVIQNALAGASHKKPPKTADIAVSANAAMIFFIVAALRPPG